MTASAIALGDPQARADLATYVSRARRLDPDGAARLVVAGAVFAAYVSPVHGGIGPTVLGLRVSAAAPGAEPVDVTVPLAALGDRLAVSSTGAAGSTGADLPIPPQQLAGVAWAGVSPPRTGWELITGVDPAVLSAVVRDGIAEVAAAVPESAAEHVVAQVRGVVWGRPVADADGIPAGAAYAAEGLGFLAPDEAVAVRRRGPWWRLSTARGHILARAALL